MTKKLWPYYLLGAVLAVVVLSPFVIFGQVQSKKPTPDMQVKMLQVQKKRLTAEANFRACSQEMASAQETFTQSDKELQTLVDEAFKKAGLSKQEYDLNGDTFEFEKKKNPEAKTP